MTDTETTEQELLRLRAENEDLRRSNAGLTVLVEGYRRLHPRLIAQAGNARLEARGLPTKPIRCASMHPDGWTCDKMHGHDGWHHHESAEGAARRVWGDR